MLVSQKVSFVFLFVVLVDFAYADFGMLNQQVSKIVSSEISKNLFERMIPRLKIKNSSGKVNQMQLSSNGGYLSLVMEDGSVRVWDLDYGVQRPAIKNKAPVIKSELDAANDRVYLLTAAKISGYDILTAKLNYEFVLDKNYNDFVLTDNGKKALLVDEGGLNLFDLQAKKRIWQQSEFESPLEKLAVDKTGKYWIAKTRREHVFSSSDLLEVGDLQTGKKLYELNNNDNAIVFFAFFGDAGMLRTGYQNGDYILWNLMNGKQTNKLSLTQEQILSMDISKDGNIVYLSDNGELAYADKESVKKLKVKVGDKQINQLLLVNDGKTIATADKGGEILLRDTDTGNEFLQLIATHEGWTVVDKVGRFDSSEEGLANVSWEIKNADIPLDSFSTKYYEPGVLSTYLEQREFINTDPEKVLAGISTPPKVKVSDPSLSSAQGGDEIVLNVEAIGLGGGVEEIHLYHNGKKLQSGQLISENKDKKQGLIKKMDFKVELSNGVNAFHAVAINAMGIEGRSNEVSLNLTAKAETDLPTLHIVSVGINKYSDVRLNLDYSVTDADAIIKIISNNNLGEYERVVQQGVFDSFATKQNILNTLGNMGQYSQDDTLVLYLAGHGIAIKGKWYFLPHETVLQKSEEGYLKFGISAREIQDVLAKNKVQKIMVMIDSCYSSAGLSAFRDLQNTQRHFSRSLSKSVGIVVLAAARYNQEALEMADLGHGLFTYVVTQGMTGLADIKPKDKKVSAHEISHFATESIPVFSKKYAGASQEPSAFVLGNDFSLLKN